MKTTLYRVTSCLMILLVAAAPVFAEANAALLRAQGSVWVNGHAVTRPTSVFTGDSIRTGAESGVTITARGSTVVVPEKSSAILRNNAIELDSGTAVLATSQGMTATVNGFTVVPTSKRARFEVQKLDGQVLITSLEGSVSVSDGKQMTLVAAGQFLKTGEGFGSKPVKATSLGAHAIFIVALAAASTAIGIAIATTTKEEVSPSVF